jgi:hypothetical protein
MDWKDTGLLVVLRCRLWMGESYYGDESEFKLLAIFKVFDLSILNTFLLILICKIN